MDIKNIKKNFESKIELLTDKEKDKYKRLLKYITSYSDKELDFENPEKIYKIITDNPNWSSINTWETNFAKLTALINISNKELGKKYVNYRVEKVKPQTKKYSNNRVLKKVEVLNYTGDVDMDYKKLILNLYIKYPPLRTDYATVKLKNFNRFQDNYYRNGVIYFNHLIKNDNNMSIELKEEEIQIIESLETEYLFGGSEKRQKESLNNSFVKAIKQYSLELFGKSVSINEFRRNYFTKFMSSVKGIDFPEAYIKVKGLAEKSNTSIEQMINYYYGKSE